MEYCVHDSDSCISLWNKRVLLYNRIELANISYMSLRCAFFRADGCKVRNMVAF